MIFRRTDKYGYSRYYGGGGPAFVIKVIVTIAVVAVLVLGGIALALQRYMVYTSNGGHLELPWANSSVSDDNGDNNDDNNTGGLLSADESGDQSADAAEISAESSSAQDDGETSTSAQPEDEAAEPVDEEPEADASTGAESSGDTSVSFDAEADSSGDISVGESGDEEQVGFFQRIWNFFANLFAKKDDSGDISPTPDEESTSADTSIGDGSTSAEPDSDVQTDDDTSGDESALSESEDEEITRPEALTGGLLLQHVSIGDVTGGFAEGDLKNVSANGIMLYLKESSGSLNYASALDLAATLNVSCGESKSDTIAATIAELSADGYYTLAYVDCFQDGSTGVLSDYQLYDEDGNTWYDGDDCAWADPANEEFQDYIVGMVQELAAMGYDEIVLKNAAYPSTGSTGSLSADCYDPETLEDTISAFYAKLAQAVEGTDTILSVITTTDTITSGADTATGQSLENMLQLGGRLWVETDTDDAEALSAALVEAGYPDNALGLLVSSLDSDAAYCQMNLD